MTGHRIVVADDEPHVLSSLVQLLQSAGHTVVGTATNGEEAIWLNQTVDADVIIMDVRMPVMDGLEAVERMMQTRPVPVVICTAHCDQDLINTACKAGAFAYVVKPCRLSDLLPAIDLAIWRFHDAKMLRGKVEALTENLRARRLIEQAKGIVMRARQLGENEAHQFLQQESQRQSKPLTELAEAIVLSEQAFFPKVLGGGKTSTVCTKVA